MPLARIGATIDCDRPGERLKAPLPETNEKGAERAPTFPVSVPVDPLRLVIVTVRSDTPPNTTLPKFTDRGVTEILIAPGIWGIPVPLNGTFMGLF